jgi:hypothetical protein
MRRYFHFAISGLSASKLRVSKLAKDVPSLEFPEDDRVQNKTSIN